MEAHFEEKKRLAFCGCKQTKILHSVMGLTRGSNDVVRAANPHSECERLGGSAECVSTVHSNWRRAIKGCALLGVDERVQR